MVLFLQNLESDKKHYFSSDPKTQKSFVWGLLTIIPNSQLENIPLTIVRIANLSAAKRPIFR